jgi:hypothetical protein
MMKKKMKMMKMKMKMKNLHLGSKYALIGDRAYVKNFWRNLVGAHCCVLVVSSEEGDAGAGSRQQPLAAVVAGIKHLVVRAAAHTHMQAPLQD